MSEEQMLRSSQISIPGSMALDERQSSQSTPLTYTKVAMLLHWGMAVLILLNLSVGFFMESFANPSPQRNNVLFYHASVGILILTLAIIRLGWRLTHRPPPLPESISRAQRAAAHGLHWTLYGLLFLQPISGYVHRMAGGHPVSFFGLFNLPALIGKNEALRLLTDAIHAGGAVILAVLVAGSLSAWLWQLARTAAR